MVERLHADMAQRTVAIAEAIVAAGDELSRSPIGRGFIVAGAYN